MIIKLGHGDYAWIAIAVGVTIYDVLAKDDELLSQAAGRYMDSHPWVWRAIVACTALHITRTIPVYLDIFHLFDLRQRLRTTMNKNQNTPHSTASVAKSITSFDVSLTHREPTPA